MNRIMAPFVAPTKVRSLQGKGPRGSGVRALWGPEWTHPPGYTREKYSHNGGMAGPTTPRSLDGAARA
jgi:hypothetical protein